MHENISGKEGGTWWYIVIESRRDDENGDG